MTLGEMNTTHFEIGLLNALEADKNLKRRGKKILAILDGDAGKRRTRQVERMERHAAAALDKDRDKIDWSQIDWAKLIKLILEVLLKLLPLILAI